MMTSEQLKQAHALLSQIEKTERDLAAYRAAAEITIGLPGSSHNPLGGWKSEIRLSAAEIGDQVVAVLERRLAAMREELRQLGIA
jgi:hypothetical protein